MSQAKNKGWYAAAEPWPAAVGSNAGYEAEAAESTYAWVDAHAADIQSLFGASAIAIGKREAGEISCICRNGSAAPALGAELGITPNAAAGLRSGCAILRKFQPSLQAAGTAGARIAVSAPRGEEPNLLVLLFSADKNAFDEIDVDLLHAHADRLELSLREQPSSNAVSTEWIAFDAIDDCDEVPHGRKPAAERPGAEFLPTITTALNSGTEPPLNGGACAHAAAAVPALLFDDLEAALPETAAEANYASGEDVAVVAAAPKRQSALIFFREGCAAWFGWFAGSAAKMPRVQAEFACSVLLVVLAASLLLGKARSASRPGSATHEAGSPSNTVPAMVVEQQAEPASTVIVAPDRERRAKRHEKPVAQHRKKSDPAVGSSGAPNAEAEPTNDVQAYEASIIAAETGDKQAKQQAQALGRKIPAREIGEVREHIAEAFQSGNGAPQDLHKAVVWHSLAAAAGNEEAKQHLDDLRNAVSPAELRSAQAEATNWLKRHASIEAAHQ